MSSKYPVDDPAFEQCGDALAMCKAVGVSLVGVQSRLSLGIPIKTTMEIVKFDLQALNERVDDLIRIVQEAEPDE